jgi:hypothetical protein
MAIAATAAEGRRDGDEEQGLLHPPEGSDSAADAGEVSEAQR